MKITFILCINKILNNVSIALLDDDQAMNHQWMSITWSTTASEVHVAYVKINDLTSGREKAKAIQ